MLRVYLAEVRDETTTFARPFPVLQLLLEKGPRTVKRELALQMSETGELFLLQ